MSERGVNNLCGKQEKRKQPRTMQSAIAAQGMKYFLPASMIGYQSGCFTRGLPPGPVALVTP
jgi:hypothetical protein